MKRVPSVVIIGRVNVGKSTLFNRLSERVKSITLDYRGVTRDFLKDRVHWKNSSFDLIDSGGIDLKKTGDEIFQKVKEIVIKLLEQADLILFVTDGTSGVTTDDRDISLFLRKFNKPVIVVVNKIDTKKARDNMYEFYSLNYDQVVFISAEHGLAINELLDAIIEKLPEKEIYEIQEPKVKVVFLGRPNVGKSSLLNVLLKQERAIVSDRPGTTREAISENIMFYKEAIEITDTPGIRRKRAIKDEIEPLMVKSSFQALRNSDIVILLIDGSENNIVDQELKLAFYAFYEQFKSLILLINKEDLMTERNKENLKNSFDLYSQLINNIPVLYISCKTGKNIGKILPLIKEVEERSRQQFLERDLTSLFIQALNKKPLYKQGELLKVFDVRQVKSLPMIIELMVNEPDWFGPSQIKYFENLMRKNYNLKGVPIKFIVKKNN